jgi:hypothetical protein
VERSPAVVRHVWAGEVVCAGEVVRAGEAGVSDVEMCKPMTGVVAGVSA